MTFSATDPARPWSARGVASVRLLVALGVEQGVTASDCLRGSAIPLDGLEDPFREIEASQELAVVRNLLGHLGHVPSLGFEVGRRYRPTTYGILGYTLLSSRSLRSAIEFAVNSLDLTFAFARYRTERQPERYVVILEDDAIPDDCRQFLIERDATATVAIMRHLVQHPLPVHRLSFRFTRPSHAERLEEYFRGPVVFGAPANAIAISGEWVDKPLPQSDEPTAQLCEAQCREILEQRRARTRLSERVRQLLLRPGAATTMDHLALELGMAPRTLRRHLDAEATSFRQLIDEVREALAYELLAQKSTVQEVAERLGYAETSSFVHAFKRWTGVSPTSYRRRSDGTRRDQRER